MDQIGGATHDIATKVDEYARGMFSALGSLKNSDSITLALLMDITFKIW